MTVFMVDLDGEWIPVGEVTSIEWSRQPRLVTTPPLVPPIDIPGPPPHRPPAVQPEEKWRQRESDMIHIEDPAKRNNGKRFTYCGLEVKRVLPFRRVDCVVCKQMSNSRRMKKHDSDGQSQ